MGADDDAARGERRDARAGANEIDDDGPDADLADAFFGEGFDEDEDGEDAARTARTARTWRFYRTSAVNFSGPIPRGISLGTSPSSDARTRGRAR